ncbi:MAG: type VI secretion system tube protein Hcp [Proteobacteria bacterium]|nr:type VI secretion system tube protein Hcp [Pseudomonadota bacterium]
MAIYMKLSTIDGPVTQKGFEKQIELNAVQLGASREIPQQTKNLQNRAIAEVNIAALSIQKEWDGVSSAKLFESICKGDTNLSATLSFTSQTDAGSLTYLTVQLTSVGLSSYSFSGVGGGGLPMESIGLSFTKIEVTPYTVGSDKKPVKGGVVQFDLATGVSS